jgi:hypothetical protein
MEAYGARKFTYIFLYCHHIQNYNILTKMLLRVVQRLIHWEGVLGGHSGREEGCARKVVLGGDAAGGKGVNFTIKSFISMWRSNVQSSLPQ